MLTALILTATTSWAFPVLLFILCPLFLQWFLTRRWAFFGGKMVSDGPLTGHEIIDDLVRRYIVLLALANGLLLAGTGYLLEADYLLWILLAIVTVPPCVLQIFVLWVTERRIHGDDVQVTGEESDEW